MTIKKALTAIKKEIEQFLTKADDRWIEPDDSRYTSILKEFEPKLSKHWQKTRDEYVKQVKTKSLEIDDTVEDYDIKPESSPYIDDALALLALAFGKGLTVGYEEIISRGNEIDIPSNPAEVFDEALEIKNYAHTALTNEQHGMDKALDKFTGKEDGKEKLKNWFDTNEVRLTDRILGGLVWYSIQFGFAKAILETTGETRFLYWITEKDKNVCKDCQDLEDNNPYSEDNPLHTVPGGGKTICGSSCRCILEIQKK